MQLTTQMQAELKNIQSRVDFISEEFWIPLETDLTTRIKITPEHVKTAHCVYTELHPYKVRLENMLCETDVKEQAHSNLS